MQNYFSRLAKALELQHRSKGALATHLGVALSTVSRWRTAAPRAETVQQTADWLGVNAKWLLHGEGSMTDMTAEKQAAMIAAANAHDSDTVAAIAIPAWDPALMLEGLKTVIELGQAKGQAPEKTLHEVSGVLKAAGYL